MAAEVIYPLGKDMVYLKNKNYNISALSYAMLNGWVDQEHGYRIISEKEFLAALKKELKLSKYKCSVILDAFLAAEIVHRSEDGYLMFHMTKQNFLKLLVPTVKFCLMHLNEFEFKTYCILANQYNIHKHYNYRDNYFFSIKDLLEKMGYCAADSNNLRRINEALALLKEIGLINYNKEFVGRPGKHGLYRELYSVEQKSTSGVEGAGIQDLIKSGKVLNEDAVKDAYALGIEVPEQCLPQTTLDDFKKMFFEHKDGNINHTRSGEDLLELSVEKHLSFKDIVGAFPMVEPYKQFFLH